MFDLRRLAFQSQSSRVDRGGAVAFRARESLTDRGGKTWLWVRHRAASAPGWEVSQVTLFLHLSTTHSPGVNSTVKQVPKKVRRGHRPLNRELSKHTREE